MNQLNYTPPSTRLIAGSESLKNQYFNKPELLKHGKLKGKTPFQLPGKLGIILILNRMPTLPRPIKKQIPFEGLKKPNYDFYNSTRWRKSSHAFRHAHPLCIECEREGKVIAATITDHIISINEGGDIWDWNNLQSLCKYHNDIKTGSQAKH